MHAEGPINGHTFSVKTFQENGPVYMPFVTRIDLSWVTHKRDDIVVGIRALRLHQCDRPITVYATKTSLETEGLPDLLLGIPEIESFVYLDEAPTSVFLNPLRPWKATMNALSFGVMNVWPKQAVTLIDYMIESSANAYLVPAVTKSFSCQAVDLSFYGVLTDLLVTYIPVAHHVGKLTLVHQGILSWRTWRQAMRNMPNIRSLTIQGSNLILADFQYFDWSLWPHIRRLDVEHNWTLKDWPDLPGGLTELAVANTGLIGPSLTAVDETIKALSCNVGPVSLWNSYLRRRGPALESVAVTMCQVTGHEVLWPFLSNVSRIDITCEGHGVSAEALARIRKVCVNSMVHVWRS